MRWDETVRGEQARSEPRIVLEVENTSFENHASVRLDVSDARLLVDDETPRFSLSQMLARADFDFEDKPPSMGVSASPVQNVDVSAPCLRWRHTAPTRPAMTA